MTIQIPFVSWEVRTFCSHSVPLLSAVWKLPRYLDTSILRFVPLKHQLSCSWLCWSYMLPALHWSIRLCVFLHTISTLMMEAVSTSEFSLNFYQTTWRNIPEGWNLQYRFNLTQRLLLINGIVWRQNVVTVVQTVLKLYWIYRPFGDEEFEVALKPVITKGPSGLLRKFRYACVNSEDCWWIFIKFRIL
jgi:hypothetical protein